LPPRVDRGFETGVAVDRRECELPLSSRCAQAARDENVRHAVEEPGFERIVAVQIEHR